MTPTRWEYQLRRVEEQIARIDRKIASEDERAQGLRLRRAALEQDKANYLTALGAERGR